MPTISLDVTRSGWGGDIRKIEGAIITLQEYLFWILQVLDSKNVKILNTNQTIIRSEDRTTHLDGSQMKMLDKDKEKRLVMGYNPETEKYEFTMYNKSGSTTIVLDGDGNAIFKGKVTASDIEGGTITGAEITGGSITGASITATSTVDVGTDVTIGKTLTLKDGNAVGGTLSIFDGTSPTVLLRSENNRPIRISTGGRVDIDGGSLYHNNKRVATKTAATGSFVSQDGKVITVEDGIIQSIG